MSEVSFARSFLAALGSKPTKISADHVEDPRSYPSRPPSILPRQSKPFKASARASSVPGTEPSLTVTLKSLRNPPLDLTLTSQHPTTSVLDVKQAVAQRTGLPVDKIKLLVRKKPVADSKVLKDLLASGVAGEGDGGANATVVEFTVMVLGGAAALGANQQQAEGQGQGQGQKANDKHVAVGLSGADVLKTDEFWTDLGGFLQQRIRDERTAGDVLGKFRGAWEGR